MSLISEAGPERPAFRPLLRPPRCCPATPARYMTSSTTGGTAWTSPSRGPRPTTPAVTGTPPRSSSRTGRSARRAACSPTWSVTKLPARWAGVTKPSGAGSAAARSPAHRPDGPAPTAPAHARPGPTGRARPQKTARAARRLAPSGGSCTALPRTPVGLQPYHQRQQALLILGPGPRPPNLGIRRGERLSQLPRPELPAAGRRWTAQRTQTALEVTLDSIAFRTTDQPLTTAGIWITDAARILGPTLLVLALLAVRSRIKR